MGSATFTFGALTSTPFALIDEAAADLVSLAGAFTAGAFTAGPFGASALGATSFGRNDSRDSSEIGVTSAFRIARTRPFGPRPTASASDVTATSVSIGT